MKSKSLILMLFLFSLIGCSSKISIKSIQNHPRNFVNKKVTIEGTVSQTFSLAFINYFELDDGTGTIKVITNNPLPAENEKLSVTGIVQYYTLATMKLLVIKENDSD